MCEAKNLITGPDLIPKLTWNIFTHCKDLIEESKLAPPLLMNSKGAWFWATHLRASFKLLRL